MPEKSFIAVVDDDESVREALTGLLGSLGYRSVAFDCPDDFLKFDNRGSVACMIADMQMPNMTGLELYNRLVALGEAIPTVLITAYPNQFVRRRALDAGVLCYLTKPFCDQDLIACVSAALDP